MHAYICMYISVSMYVCMYVYVYVCNVFMYACVDVCIHAWMYVCTVKNDYRYMFNIWYNCAFI